MIRDLYPFAGSFKVTHEKSQKAVKRFNKCEGGVKKEIGYHCGK